MAPLGLLLAASLALSFLAQSCDIGAFSIDDVSDTITITNASTSQAAMVIVSTSQDSGQLVLAAGQSETFTALAATRYTVEVASLGGAQSAGYRASLVTLRNDLEDLSINPGDSGVTPEAALGEVLVVTRALQQLQATGLQSCSHALVAGADNHATLTWTTAGLGDLWVLDCE